ncbi:AAA ATPase [Thermoproteus uzoniensis 768-20]|uniref:AAA ATPase n=1 Tax=Thermoproteus uzoniensis (strain 768-20) TaxID=999630 RepID=F2L1Y9_THEU7|nr:DUF87 domain-containing protein [Thermoproteus uzoniensis]AEA11730.1 AAA ATPase [Thermoproteus uzoniensis 768-20]
MIDIALTALVSLALATYIWRDDEVFVGLGSGGLVYLPLDKHITIIGPTRSGKTTLAKKIASRSGKKVVVMDWNGEYSLGLKINASKLKLDISNINKKILAELIGISLNLNEPSIYFLYRSIKDQEVKRPKDLLTAIDSYLTTTKSETEMKAAILRRLEYILDALDKGRIPLDFIIKYNKNITIDLSSLSLVEEKILIISLILTFIYNKFRNMSITKNIKLILIVDEAQNILNLNIIRHIITEMAKYGIRVVLVTNILPPPDVMAHTNIILVKPHISYNFKVNNSSIIINDKIIKIYKFI